MSTEENKLIELAKYEVENQEKSKIAFLTIFVSEIFDAMNVIQ